jgi:cell division protein FtsN
MQLSAEEMNSVPVKAENVEPAENPIVEIEEKLVPIDEVPVDNSQYFVIIGSFRNKNNAMKYQAEIGEKGFAAILLQNEQGLFRVSVKATNQINDARNEIQRIRQKYPEHSDTWLLIKKK